MLSGQSARTRLLWRFKLPDHLCCFLSFISAAVLSAATKLRRLAFYAFIISSSVPSICRATIGLNKFLPLVFLSYPETFLHGRTSFLDVLDYIFSPPSVFSVFLFIICHYSNCKVCIAPCVQTFLIFSFLAEFCSSRSIDRDIVSCPQHRLRKQHGWPFFIEKWCFLCKKWRFFPNTAKLLCEMELSIEIISIFALKNVHENGSDY